MRNDIVKVNSPKLILPTTERQIYYINSNGIKHLVKK